MQCFTGQETVMNSLQNSIRTVLVGFSNRTTNNWLLCDVWHAYKYFDIAPDSADIQVTGLVCFALTFDTTLTILILYSTYNYGPTYNRYKTHFVNSRAKQETNMWCSSIKESRNGTWSVNIRVSILKTPNFWRFVDHM